MTERKMLRLVAIVALFSGALSVCGDVGPATRPTVNLGGAERFLTYVNTDKPIYRPGEKVYVRGVMLRADDHTPLSAVENAMFEIKGPKGDIVASGEAQVQDSVLGFGWEIPAGQAGGEYTLNVTHPWTGHAPAERKFDIRSYRAPRLKSQIVFVRDGYGPGDLASATLHVERAEGGIPAGAKVTAVARVDGEEAFRGETKVDESGNCGVSFKLPANIARGEGTLGLTIQDGGAVETASKTIPILLQTVDLNIYPEGGDLVAGLANRVYFEARTPAKKPADISGVVVDAAGKEVATFRSEHEGRGRFSFTPAKDGQYSLKITEPAGIKTTFPLPASKATGVVLTASSDVVEREANVGFTLTSATARSVKVTLAKRDKELASSKVDLKANEASALTLTPPASADGVLIATVWDENGTPLAERLIFRKPAQTLKVHVTADRNDYVPGDKVNLTVTTTDENDKPVGAMVGLTVTDDSVLEMIEKREQAARLPVMVFLENDVQELADAHVYMDNANPKAGLATDLLLGTQGWRRFAFVDPTAFITTHGDLARRVLALKFSTEAELATTKPGEDGDDVIGVGGAGFGGGKGRRPMPMLRMAAAANEPEAAGDKAKLDVDEKKPPFVHALPPDKNDDQLEQAIGQADKAKDLQAIAGTPANGPMAKRMAQRQPIISVREYAHALIPNRIEGERRDFTETLYWNAGVKTDDKTGQASVSFALSDAVTTFRVFSDAFNKSGTLGSGTSAVQSVQPFYVEPKLPLEITSGDKVQIPLSLVNGTTRDFPIVNLVAKDAPGIDITIDAKRLELNNKARIRSLIGLDVGTFSGTFTFDLKASAGPFSDHVFRPITVTPLGFPHEDAHGGLLAENSTFSQTIVIPDNRVDGSITSSIAVYPTPLANMTGALERLIQEPNGCFEQTSSTSYPLIMAQQYFMTHTGVDATLVERSRTNLDAAYKRLTGFECKQKGYEWFGGDPGHEALTAYGLLEFVDMSNVRDVDKAMIQRTREWLLARRDGKGGFLRNDKQCDSFGGAPPATTDAYVVWALLESGQKDLDKEIANIKASAGATSDSYIVALGANILALSGDKDGASKLMEKLAKKQSETGVVQGGETSITRSSGEALEIETTALSLLAWMRDPTYMPNVEKSMKWLAEQCKSGRFGSTQSTILALRAIVDYDKSRARPKVAGDLVLSVDGKTVGEAVHFTPDTQGALVLPDIAPLMTPGKHVVELKMEKGGSMPFAMTVKYFNAQPESSDKCKVGLEVKLRDAKVEEGGITEAAVTVTNRTKEILPTPVAIVGIPGGLEVRHDQLKELVKSGKIDAYEVSGRQVILYWRALQPEVKLELPISLIAAIPGSYTAPASRTYLYYTDEFKQWTAGVTVTITPKAR